MRVPEESGSMGRVTRSRRFERFRLGTCARCRVSWAVFINTEVMDQERGLNTFGKDVRVSLPFLSHLKLYQGRFNQLNEYRNLNISSVKSPEISFFPVQAVAGFFTLET